MAGRSADERVADVRRLLAAAAAVHEARATIALAIARDTGLTPEGVELGFASLERHATGADLAALVAAAGDTDRVHVILSANVFVAPLRAFALARAAAPRVTVRPSSRDPSLTLALVRAAHDDAIEVLDDRELASVDAGEVHVYGTDETIEAVRRQARVRVRGHGAGMGMAVVTDSVDIDEAAEALAADIVPFDQRGCLSPRMAWVEGDEGRARRFADALDASLRGWEERVPRGTLLADEGEAATRWVDAMAFAGRVWCGEAHAVGLAGLSSALAIPPPGRHLLVLHASTLEQAFVRAAPVASFVVAIGSDDVPRVTPLAPSHARLSSLGQMQHPALDGPVDRR